jgi:hypothetical protein
LNDTDGPVIFSIPRIQYGNVKRHAHFLTDIAKKKKVIMLIRTFDGTSPTSPMQSIQDSLERLGIEVRTTQDEIANYVLIGNRIVWYGSIHPFSKVEPDETLLRLEDPTYTADFLSLWNEPPLHVTGT